jgi:iron complex outermembrane recepter protein
MPTAARPIPFARSTLVLLLTAALPALAQETTQRIEITGSSIKRIDAETALPVRWCSASSARRLSARSSRRRWWLAA